MTEIDLIEIASWALLMGGAFFMLVGALGVLRLPDVYTRLHAAGVTDTLGAALMIAGMSLQAGLTLLTVKLFLILIFLWFTGPVSSHALAQSALLSGRRPKLAHNRLSAESQRLFELDDLPTEQPRDDAEVQS
ncbi:MAG: monovalent cation/H(+) antiporter subunit G [Alphaproteobacteria bacterium]